MLTDPVTQYPDTMRVIPVPTWPTFIVVAVVEASVAAPVTSRVLCSERAPAAVVVALPFIHKGPPIVADWVVDELDIVVTPVTPSVVENEPDVPTRAPRSVSWPAEPKVEVAVAPKYAVFAESIVEDALPSEERPVTASVPPVETFVLIVVAA
jgi:hypothetical protein